LPVTQAIVLVSAVAILIAVVPEAFDFETSVQAANPAFLAVKPKFG